MSLLLLLVGASSEAQPEPEPEPEPFRGGRTVRLRIPLEEDEFWWWE